MPGVLCLKPILHYALGLRFGKVCKQNARKMQEKHNWLAFLPNVWCNIETFSRIFLTLGNFLLYFLCFSRGEI